MEVHSFWIISRLNCWVSNMHATTETCLLNFKLENNICVHVLQNAYYVMYSTLFQNRTLVNIITLNHWCTDKQQHEQMWKLHILHNVDIYVIFSPDHNWKLTFTDNSNVASSKFFARPSPTSIYREKNWDFQTIGTYLPLYHM